MILEDKQQVATAMRISRTMVENYGDWWEHARHQLINQYMGEIFPEMIGDDKYHVMKFDYYRRECVGLDEIEIVLTCHHAIANQERIIIPVFDEFEFTSQGFKKTCSHCGNVLTLDYRGGCVACGGPAGEPHQW